MTASDRRYPKWPKRVLKTLGVLHVFFAVYGLYLLVATVGFRVSWPDVMKRTGEALPYDTEAFILRTMINLVFLGAIAIAGLQLLRSRLSGTTISNVLFVAMLVYFLFPFWDLFGPGFSRSMGATAGTGNMGIAPQLITGYPILALVLLNLASHKLRAIQATELAGA